MFNYNGSMVKKGDDYYNKSRKSVRFKITVNLTKLVHSWIKISEYKLFRYINLRMYQFGQIDSYFEMESIIV